jgi:hypothetical protein
MPLGRFGHEVWFGEQQAGIVLHQPHQGLRVRTSRRREQIDARAAREFVKSGRAIVGIDLSNRRSSGRIQLHYDLSGLEGLGPYVGLRRTGGT